MTSFTSERKLRSPAEREAEKAFRQADAKKAMSEHERNQNAFHKNFQRLKAERLAREAKGFEPEAGKTKPVNEHA